MTSRERLLAVLHGRMPDCVPVCPDISNMVPCRLTGKPFWEIYAFQDPPLWKAHIDALKYFDIDGGFELYDFGSVDPLTGIRTPWTEHVVRRYEDGRFVTQNYNVATGIWSGSLMLYTADNPPAANVVPAKLGLPATPIDPEPLIPARRWPEGLELWLLIREKLGDQGVLGMQSGMVTNMMPSVEAIYAYYDDPKPFFELAADLGIPTHVHSCGPESELVRMAAEETELTIIDPLEVRPMGDCDLAQLKRLYGSRIVLKGNLHTTEVMLHGSVDDVVRASTAAIDAAAAEGGFILSTGDQCGKDTPDENIVAMVQTARTYGRY